MIAIKGMKMPKYCNDCEFCHDSFGYCNLASEYIPGHSFFKDENEKPDFCPLVEIVTCKDCKHNRDGVCPNYRHFVDDNFYCADAERISEE
jgi:hypothetical protein